MKLKIVGARLAFPVLFTPEQVNGEGEEKYSCNLLIGPDRDLVVLQGETEIIDDRPVTRYVKKIKITDAMEAVGSKHAWKKGSKWASVKNAMEKQDRAFLHDGDLKDKYAGFAGQWYVSAGASIAQRPKVVDTNGRPLTERDGRVYSGCYVIGLIELWAQDNEWGQRINAQLRGIQFLRDGDSFGGGSAPAADDEFDDVSAGADADDIG